MKTIRRLSVMAGFALTLLPGLAASAQWQTLAPLPDPIGFGGMFAGVLQGQLVAGGGAHWTKPIWLDGKKVFSDHLYALAIPSGAWTELPVKLPVPSGYFASAAAAGVIYLAGGIDAHGCRRAVLALSESNGALQWTHLPDLPLPVGYGCAAVAGGRLYVVGGLHDPASTTPTNDVWSLDVSGAIVNQLWRREPNLPGTGVFVAAAAGIGDSLYVFGGMRVEAKGGYAPSAAACRLNVTTGKWHKLTDLPEPRVGPASPCPVLADGRILVAGGYAVVFPGSQREHPGFNTRTFYYDPAHDHWSDAPVLPKAAVQDRDEPADPGPAPMLGAPGVVWRNLAVAVSGEVRASVRSPQVLALPLPETAHSSP